MMISRLIKARFYEHLKILYLAIFSSYKVCCSALSDFFLIKKNIFQLFSILQFSFWNLGFDIYVLELS